MKKYGLGFYEKMAQLSFLIFKREKGDPMVTLAIVQWKDSGGEIHNLNSPQFGIYISISNFNY